LNEKVAQIVGFVCPNYICFSIFVSAFSDSLFVSEDKKGFEKGAASYAKY